MRISSTGTEIPNRGRLKRSSSSRDARADAADASRRKAAQVMRISSPEIEVSGEGRLKRSSSPESASASYPTWVILNRFGARRDCFDGDGTTSAVSYTSGGEQVSVSFVLEKPPRTSLITLDWPQGPDPSEGSTSDPYVVAAHRNVVLLEIISRAKYRRPASIDFFVYKASGPPSLTRLPVCYWKGPSNADSPRPRIMGKYSTGLLSCSDDSFVVADLARGSPQPSEVDIYLMCSGFNDWKVFRDVPIHHASGVEHLSWWSTDGVFPWRHHYLIWVDYLRGLIFARIKHPGNDIIHLQEPVLRYVPLPVDPVQGNPYDSDNERGCPGASRSVCNTHHGIKFVNVNRFGCSFTITLWSLCQNKKWREEATLDAAQLWDICSENCIPKVQPEFPVVDMENPYAICFLLNEGRYTVNPDTPTWMIKIHMKKKVLLDSHCYSMKGSQSYPEIYTTARRMSEGLSISSEIPSYLSGQTMERNLIGY